MSYMDESIGNRIRKRRKELGYKTQKALADVIGVDSPSITAWENNYYQPNGGNLRNLCAALRCSPNYIIDGEPISKDNESPKENAVSYSERPRSRQKIQVHSFDQIINNKNQGIEEMSFAGEITDSSLFCVVETDLMEGVRPHYAPRGSIIRIETNTEPVPGDLVLYNLNGSPVLGELTVVAGTKYAKPSNTQYQAIPVQDAALIGVVEDIIIKARRR